MFFDGVYFFYLELNKISIIRKNCLIIREIFRFSFINLIFNYIIPNLSMSRSIGKLLIDGCYALCEKLKIKKWLLFLYFFIIIDACEMLNLLIYVLR